MSIRMNDLKMISVKPYLGKGRKLFRYKEHRLLNLFYTYINW